MIAFTEQRARDFTGSARAGELSLALDCIYEGETSPWGVPAYRFDIVSEDRRVGTISLRIGPDEGALRYAGHLGFAVDEPWRGRRIAERAVRLLLPLARDHGLEAVWLTCRPDNAASMRVMERLGASFVETLPIPPDYPAYAEGEREKKRFRLEL